MQPCTDSSLTDEDLIAGYLLTKSDAYFGQLYQRYVHKVYKHCLRITRHREQAQDCTQDIFLKVLHGLNSFTGQARFSTWLHAVSYNHCVTQLRLRIEFVSLDAQECLEHQFAESSEEGFAHRMEIVEQILAGLSPLEGALLRLKYLEGQQMKAIAQDMDLSMSAVKMRLMRGRAKVKQHYDHQRRLD